MVVKPKKLLTLCEQCWKEFNPKIDSEDGHTDRFLEKWGVEDEAAQMFVRQVFYGCHRYSNMLKSMVTAYLNFYHRMKSEEVKFWIVAYLALVRFDDLSLADFKSILTIAFQPNIVAELLGFLFSEEMYQAQCVPLLKLHYGDDYIQGPLLEYIQAHAEQMKNIAAGYDAIFNGTASIASKEMSMKMSVASGGEELGTKVPRAPKAAVPFNLSKPRARPPLELEAVTASPKPVKPKDGVTTEIQGAISEFKKGKKSSTLDVRKKEENRQREATMPFKPPKLHGLHRPSNLEAVRERQAEAYAKEVAPEIGRILGPLEVREMHAQMPEVPVNMTKAAIARENLYYQRKMEEELNELAQKEKDLHDVGNFAVWQMEMQEKDRKEAEALVARRKLEMMIADENAKEAKRKQVEENLAAAQKARVERNEEFVRLAAEEEERIEQLQAKAGEQKEERREAVKVVKRELKKQREETAAVVKKESQDNEVRLAQLMQLERQRKQELMAEIRALAANRPMKGLCTHTQGYDPTTTAGAGMLNEMSLVELRQKLKEVKAELKEEEEQRRDGILKRKIEDRNEWAAKVENIERGRQATRMEKHRLREETRAEKARLHKEKVEREEVLLIELQEKLAAKREATYAAEMERRAAEKERKVKAQLLNADKAMMEFKRWQEMERGMELATELTQDKRITEGDTKMKYDTKLALQRRRNFSAAVRQSKQNQKQSDLLKTEKATVMTARVETEYQTMKAAVMSDKQRKTQLIQRKLDMMSTRREQSVRDSSVRLMGVQTF
mmetsp:Transcript_45044/g.80570  ORF Transcript_45044/g.80570 Transcript_45044/m.80570 type:complete len:784 (-) Transcript_45044:119-2470(-)